ncbi:hypothetical protein NIES2101_34735 [Calothrix sp. HK-06]|nr:hypothetical protein NIES2101_34735 [Calothrix sp. HK-06]
MELNKALAEDECTCEEVVLYLEIIRGLVGSFQIDFSAVHDYLCAEAHNNRELSLSDCARSISIAIEILAGATTETTTAIDIPKNWKSPKFKFGQLTTQGKIVGMNYYHSSSLIDGGEGWAYLVQSLTTEKLENIDEFKIELLSPEKIRAAIEREISFYKSQIAALEEKLDFE